MCHPTSSPGALAESSVRQPVPDLRATACVSEQAKVGGQARCRALLASGLVPPTWSEVSATKGAIPSRRRRCGPTLTALVTGPGTAPRSRPSWAARDGRQDTGDQLRWRGWRSCRHLRRARPGATRLRSRRRPRSDNPFVGGNGTCEFPSYILSIGGACPSTGDEIVHRRKGRMTHRESTARRERLHQDRRLRWASRYRVE